MGSEPFSLARYSSHVMPSGNRKFEFVADRPIKSSTLAPLLKGVAVPAASHAAGSPVIPVSRHAGKPSHPGRGRSRRSSARARPEQAPGKSARWSDLRVVGGLRIRILRDPRTQYWPGPLLPGCTSLPPKGVRRPLERLRGLALSSTHKEGEEVQEGRTMNSASPSRQMVSAMAPDASSIRSLNSSSDEPAGCSAR